MGRDAEIDPKDISIAPGDMTATTTQTALLRLDRRDIAGLTWVRDRSRFWQTVLKRRRKYGVRI